MMAADVGIEGLRMLTIDQHRLQLLTENKMVPNMGGNACFGIHAWMKDFLAALREDDWMLLRSRGMHILEHIVNRRINWSLLNAAVSFWNPKTHTFFFPTGEMTILQEEVAPLLGIRGINSEEGHVLGRVAVLGECEQEHFFFSSSSGDIFQNCIRQDMLSLRIFWEKHQNDIVSCTVQTPFKERELAVRQRQAIINILFGGIFLFTTGDYRVPRAHVALLAAHDGFGSNNLVHSILAYLTEGLSNASMCGWFFGSPWLLQEWLCVHFPSIGRIIPGKSGLIITPRSLQDWLVYFSRVTDTDVIFCPYHTLTVTVPCEPSKLRLIGALGFPLYSARRCCRMLELANVAVKVVPAVSMLLPRDLDDSSSDQIWLMESIEQWNEESEVILLTGAQANREAVSEYTAQMRTLVPIFETAAGGSLEQTKKRRRRR